MAVLAVMAMATPSKADVIVGEPADIGTGNCIPFGCTLSTPTYQQIYAASDFSGPITITNLEFYDTQGLNPGASPNTGTYTISLSTTSTPVDGLVVRFLWFAAKMSARDSGGCVGCDDGRLPFDPTQDMADLRG